MTDDRHGRRSARAAAALAAAALLGLGARAQAQPAAAKPIRFIMAAPAGSSIDVLGRVLAERMREALGETVVVENLPAAGGTVATATIARAAPDGSTLGIAFNGPLAFAPYLYARLAYDPLRDLQPIVLTTSQPNVLAVSAGVPAKTVRDLIEYARSQPGRLNYASVGNGSSSHLTMELFKSLAGFDAAHVPFNGSPPALNALASGDAQMIFAVPTAIAPLAQAGKVRMLAVSSAGRWRLLPELPSVAEAALPGFESFAWNGVIGPAGMAPERIATLNRVLDRALREPSVKTRLNASGLEPVGGTPGEFAALIRAEAQKWAPVIGRTGVKID
ncbi:MAG: tripartite tricarboxylate transporter substrate binding protein [Betaproteobacteria bacterium]|nr:MAG: tripartite tricarboxylate transporter substrate binding protein [Betaproteobacteria bacterium]